MTGIANLREPGRFSDGGGLYLRVSPTITKSWVFRYVRGEKSVDLGLGAFPAVSLANARKQAAEFREQLAAGIDPKTKRADEKKQLRTFGEVADSYMADMGGRWTADKTRAAWDRTLNSLAAPVRSRPVGDISTGDILGLLQPIWQSKPETAAKARMRFESVLDYAKAKGWREGENPARWRGHLSNILPPRQKLSRGHHQAMQYAEVPAFMESLQDRDAMSALALRFLILTAARTSEVLKAAWPEFDFDNTVWTVPAERMKARKEHRVPLTDDMLSILQPLYDNRISEYVFPGQRSNRPLSNMAMEILMKKRMGITNATPHGFRSSFRDWAGDCTSFPREIAEAALAHKLGDSVELAYRRGDALEKRRALMEAWGDHCQGRDSGNVVQLAVQQ